MKQPLLEAIKGRALLGDGAMGTQLMIAGLEQGACGEAWNLTHPERVTAIQRRYAEAGSDCILTNTFGGSRIMLNRHGNADNVGPINKAAVDLVREAFKSVGREGYVIGDIGPFGGLMEPYGEFTEEQVRDAFTEQAKALVDAGADAIIIETQTSLEELLLGIEAVAIGALEPVQPVAVGIGGEPRTLERGQRQARAWLVAMLRRARNGARHPQDNQPSHRRQYTGVRRVRVRSTRRRW